MTEIDVACAQAGDGWRCHVRVADPRPGGRAGAAATDHVVHVAAADLARLAPGASEPSDLVHRSFEFLLERESKEAILRSFDLPIIGRYFPEYEEIIRRRV
jgi:hypothetical protein